MMVAILNSAILNFFHLGFIHLSFPLRLLTLAKIGSHYLHKKTSLVHSDSTWWLQPSWILPCQIESLPSWIQTPCYLLSDLLKNTLSPLWLWLKLIQSDSNSFIPHLTWWWQPYCILSSWILSFWILPSWIQPFSSKLWLQLIQSDSKSFILTQLDDGSHLGFSHFSQK